MSSHPRVCTACGGRLDLDEFDDHCDRCLVALNVTKGQTAEIPLGFWHEGAMLAALHSRHMGRVIQAFRQHPANGSQPLSQARVGKWVHLSQAQVSRIENGPPVVHIDRLIEWALILQIPRDFLWFAFPGRATPSAFRDRSPSEALGVNDSSDAALDSRWVDLDMIESVIQFTREDLSMDRRTATRTLANLVLGAALFEPLERWIYGSPEALPRVDGNVRIGAEEVSQIENAARIFREWDDQFGGGLRRKAVIGQLSEVGDLVRHTSSANLRKRLLAVMGHLSETAAIMSWDSGEQSAAQRYYILAFRSARSAGDIAFSANVLAGMARQLLYLGRAADALELIRLGQSSPGGELTPTIRSMLHTREAWAYSKQGRIAAFRHATDQALETLARSQSVEDPYWISYYDQAEFSGTTGGRLLELSHNHPAMATEAIEYIERAIKSRSSGRLRSSALDRLGLAESRLVQNEPVEAARIAHEAIEIVSQTPSTRVRVKLAEFHEYSRSYDDVPAIIELRDRIRPILTSSI
jgi:tetratricopeptide (TPR) repeat protein